MYTKHFLRMFIRLIGMALIGLGLLVFINHYQQSAPVEEDPFAPQTNSFEVE